MLALRLHLLTLILLPGLAVAQEFDRPISGKVQVGVHTLKLSPDAAYTVRFEHSPYTQYVHRPNTLQVPLLLTGERNPQEQLLSPAKEGEYRLVVTAVRADSRPEPYTMSLSRSALGAKPIFEEKGELKPGPRKPSEFKAKAGHLYVIECAYDDPKARPILNLYDVTMRGQARVIKQVAQNTAEIPVARFVYRAPADGTLEVAHQTSLGFDAKSKGYTLRVWESEKPGVGEPVGEAVKGATANGVHKFRLGPDAIYFATLKTERGPLSMNLSKGVPRDWKDAPAGTTGFYHSVLAEQEVLLTVSPVHYDPALTTGEHDYTLTVKRLALDRKPLPEIKGETTKSDPVYAGAHFKMHPVELKAGRWYAIDMLQGDRKVTLYPFLEDLSKPQTGSLRNIVDQASGAKDSPGRGSFSALRRTASTASWPRASAGMTSATTPSSCARRRRSDREMSAGGSRRGGRLAAQLDDDTAEVQQAVDAREPVFLLPAQSARLTLFLQFPAVVRAAMPEAAAQRAREGVLGREQQQLAAGGEDARQLAQAGHRVRQVLQYPAADDGVERAVGVRQPRQVGDDVGDARVLQSVLRPRQHLRRQVEGGQDGVGVGVFEEELRVAAVAAGGVEDVLAAADVERAGADEPAGERLVARHEAGEGGQRAGQAVVVAANEALVVGKRLAVSRQRPE